VAELTVHEDAAALGAAVARALADAAAAAIAARGRFRLALPGGSGPDPVYDALAAGGPGRAVDWTRVDVFLADERAVPVDDPLSNARVVREHLLARVGAPPACLARPRADAADLDAAAREYAERLTAPLDLVVLGLGDDGHVASLFEGSPLLHEDARLVAAVLDSPKPPPRRLTLTPRTLRAARATCVIARGAAKAGAVARAFDPATADRVPTAALCRVAWHLDREAASRLARRSD
jgi:6-phosphogluconolactonase